MSEIISIPILELMEKTEQWLLNQGYKKNTLGVYKATWNKFRAYSSSPFYDRETAEKFLLRYFGVDANAIDQKLDMRMRHARRHMSALDEFLRTGEICRRKVRGITTIADDGFDLFFSRFLDFCREQNYSKSWLDNTISGLRIFLLATHVSNTSTPEGIDKLKGNSTFVPHIFTVDEISRILNAADNLPYRKNAPTRHLVIPAVIRLLYSCGLRVNEALRLRTTDVDLESGVISIFNGKGGKDRFVPIHSSLSEYLREYTGKLLLDREWFFPSASGHYSSNTIYENFRELLFKSHIRHTGNGPRVHDFRHTFAVHTLEKQLAEGYDPMIIVPRLAAYLGHKSYRETCWYIHLTIASFPELAQKLDSAFAGIIPVIGGEIIEED